MPKFAAHPVDVHVGTRVRERRKALQISQTDLGGALGLTFQQVQKYERGHNRISASKLWETARTLKVTIDYFFEGLDDGDTSDETQPMERHVAGFLKTAEGVELARTFPAINSPRHRRKICDLVKAMAVSDDA